MSTLIRLEGFLIGEERNLGLNFFRITKEGLLKFGGFKRLTIKGTGINWRDFSIWAKGKAFLKTREIIGEGFGWEGLNKILQFLGWDWNL